ncbi:hypothetical protein KPH14_009636 [Odynerus spinipes]|uniref:RNA 3'-terminal phosphate cyclase n=1 Tax=Odynerus spinipes TaxID=1348599 RepID=A0AAD9RR01_9HYME|nr:hypothetical protein KPH14_009636 [Odynerus spinipes]
MSSVVKIDGSLGEGGGQVLRIALSLSALYGIPIEINNIRAGRPKPGLAAQHLKGVELVRDMCNAKVSGGYVGSTHLEFHPGPLNRPKHEFQADTQTAGCICLLAQVALPCALFIPQKEPVTLILKGGTNVPMGPHIEYLTEVMRPILNKFGADFDFVVLKRGYYPKGGGEVHLRVTPVKNLNAVDITDLGIPHGISGWAYVAGCVHTNEAYKMSNDAKALLTDELTRNNIRVPPINIESYREDRGIAVGNGSGINIVCTTTTGCVFGGSGLGPARQDEPPPGVIAANQILEPFLAGSCIDEHTQDQIIIFMALAKGVSRVRVGSKKLTCHTETAIQVAEIMLGNRGLHFNLLESGSVGDSPSYILECEGCGLINSNFVE